MIDPRLRFGRPNVDGVSTEMLWEYSKDGYSYEGIAHDFGFSESSVE